MGWTRASSIDRALQCTGSVHLWNTVPAVRLIQKSENAQTAAAWGTMVHTWKETGIVEGTESHVKTFNKKLATLEASGISRLDIWPASGFHEVSVAYHCVDGRVAICYEGDANIFKEGHPEPWITGTLDYYLFDGKKLIVDDLKTGAMFDKDPEEMGQMYFYCMVLNKILRPTEEPTVSVTHWPKYTLDCLPDRREGTLSFVQLGKFEDRLKSDYVKYKTIPEFKLGDECDWCPVKSLCPLLKKAATMEIENV